MEFIDVVDENGIPTGRVVERSEAHRLGLRHRTSHVWIVRRHNDSIQILLQKRCMQKDSYPGCYDISSAGHIPAGDDYIVSALRELKEELGIEARPEELLDCGIHHCPDVDDNFHGKHFIDHQISHIFLLWRDMEEEEFIVQKEEIDSVRWVEFHECMELVRTNAIPHCIDIRELEKLEKYLGLS